MSRSLCLRGDEIDRFRFLLENDYRYEDAARLAPDLNAVSQIWEDLRQGRAKPRSGPKPPPSRSNSVVVPDRNKVPPVVAGTSRDTAKCAPKCEPKITAAEYFAKSGSSNTVAKNADSAKIANPTVVNPPRPADPEKPSPSFVAPSTGTIVYPRSVIHPAVRQLASGGTKIRMAITAVNHPQTKLDKAGADKIQDGLATVIATLRKPAVPRILQFSLDQQLGYIRVVCADQDSVDWLKQVLPKVKKAYVTDPICMVPEEKFNENVYVVQFPNSLRTTTRDFLGWMQAENAGIDTTKWKVISRTVLRDTTTVELRISLPSVPDEQLLAAAGGQLVFQKRKVTFVKQAATAIKKNNAWGSAAFTAYIRDNPNNPNETAEDVLRIIARDNIGLVTANWTIAEAKRIVMFKKKVFHITFIVDKVSEDRIRKDKNGLKYKYGMITLKPRKLETAVNRVTGDRRRKKERMLDEQGKQFKWVRNASTSQSNVSISSALDDDICFDDYQ